MSLSLKHRLPAIVLLVATLFSLAPAAQSDDRAAGIQDAINRQLSAFRARDANRAWAIAAPVIQRKFGTRERFMEMVGTYYPQIMNSQSAIFKGLREIDGNLVQRVFVEGGPGDFVDAYYTMKLIDGAWRITAVFVQKPKSEGA